MKKLILIRHAKSSWETFSTDKQRPLLERGVSDAHLVAASVAASLPKSFTVFSSDAKRAAQTALLFSTHCNFTAEEIRFIEELYTFNANELERVVKAFDDRYDCVILFGHNEAITDFVNKFGDVTIDNVSTSGFVWLEFEANSWHSITKGKTVKVVFPKDLR